MAQKNYNYKGCKVEVKYPDNDGWETPVTILKDWTVVEEFTFEYAPEYALSEAQERIDLIESRKS